MKPAKTSDKLTRTITYRALHHRLVDFPAEHTIRPLWKVMEPGHPVGSFSLIMHDLLQFVDMLHSNYSLMMTLHGIDTMEDLERLDCHQLTAARVAIVTRRDTSHALVQALCFLGLNEHAYLLHDIDIDDALHWSFIPADKLEPGALANL